MRQILAGVTHVDAEDVGAGLEQLVDHLRAAGGRSQRGDDLGAAVTSHRRSPSLLVPEEGPDGGAGGGEPAAGGSAPAPGGVRGGAPPRGGNGRSTGCSAVSVNCTVQE